MPCYRKRSPKLRFQFVPAQRQPVCSLVNAVIIANGQPFTTKLPCTIGEFQVTQKLLPRRVVVGRALAEFSQRD